MAALATDARELVQLARREAAAGRLQRSLALVAGLSSGLSGLEVAYEHYRGSYGTRIMWTPVLLAPVLMGAGVAGAVRPRLARTVLPWVAGVTLADCLTGFVFHIRGIARKPGGWRLLVPNVAMGPPIFAPLLFGTSAYMGLVAAQMQPEGGPAEAPAKAERLRRHLAVITAISAVCSGVEALYSHYKSNFRFLAQWTPIVIAPALAAAALASLQQRQRRRQPLLLPALSALAMADGAVGFGYHVRGVLRRPGGKKNLIYNIIYGPPVLAPLLFAACGLLGVLAAYVGRPRS